MKHLFIINPAAGKKKTTKELEQMLEKLSFPYEVVYTSGEGHAQKITEEAVRENVPIRIYACGGDGTLNEVVNGAAGHDHVAITCIPKGTGNDFLKVFGSNYRSAFYDIETLAKGPQTSFDLMDCNGKLGIDVVCAGLDARIAADVHRYKDWTFISGMGAYILSLIENVFFKGISQKMTVKMGNVDWQNKETSLICICNGRHYGGGFMPVKNAMPDDGILDVVLVKKVGILKLISVVKEYAKGLYYKYPNLTKDYHGQMVKLSAPKQITVVVDGEVMYGDDFTIKLSNKKINFFYPDYVSYQVENK